MIEAEAEIKLFETNDKNIQKLASSIKLLDGKIEAKLESSEFTSFQDGEYAPFKKITNEFIGDSEKWEMKWNKIFNGTDANEDTYESYITFQNGEQILGNSRSNIKLHLKNDVIQYEDSGGNILASFDAENICLGKNSSRSIIDLCSGSGKIAGYTSEYGDIGIELTGPHYVHLFTEGVTVDSNYAGKSSALLMSDEFLEMFLNDGTGGWSSRIALERENIKFLGNSIFLSPVTITRTMNIDNMCGMQSDDEGGNVWINSKSNTYHYEWDAYQDTYARMYSYRNSDGLIHHWTYNGDTGDFTADGCVTGQLSGLAQFRAVGGSYGFMIRNDGVNTYFLFTNEGDQWGGWNTLRPFVIENQTGKIVFESLVLANGSLRIVGGENSAQMSGSGNWISMTSSGTSGGHGNLGSSNNYWSGVYYTSLHQISDKRKKRDLGTLNLEEALILLKNTKPVKYSMLDDSEDMIRYGVFAQDVRDMLIDNNIGYRTVLNIGLMDGSEQISTNLYEPEDNVSYSVDYVQYVAPLIKGWQYHNKQLEELTVKYNDLEGRYNSLTGLINFLTNRIHELEMAM